jgi:hypothetical protein
MHLKSMKLEFLLLSTLTVSMISATGSASPFAELSSLAKDATVRLEKESRSVSVNSTDDCENFTGEWIATCDDPTSKATSEPLKIEQYGCKGTMKSSGQEWRYGQTIRAGESFDGLSWNTEAIYMWNAEHNKLLQRGVFSLIIKDSNVSSIANGQSGFLTGQIELKDDKLIAIRSFELYMFLTGEHFTKTQKCIYTRKK